MARFLVLALVSSLAAGFQAPVSKLSLSKLPQPVRVAPVTMQEPTDKAITIGAAAVGGVLAVYLFHELSTAVVVRGSPTLGPSLASTPCRASLPLRCLSWRLFGSSLTSAALHRPRVRFDAHQRLRWLLKVCWQVCSRMPCRPRP